MTFEWHSRKATLNLKRHGVSFEEAVTAFGDRFSMTFPDTGHSIDEGRFLLIGSTTRNRILVVSHTYREDTIRLISARPATRRERTYYEDGREPRTD